MKSINTCVYNEWIATGWVLYSTVGMNSSQYRLKTNLTLIDTQAPAASFLSIFFVV